ncbi:hypothetical protein [Cyanobium sp. LEGE 06143]|nr:hypothetical protein [Cyanobium sp. LEGE 06143]
METDMMAKEKDGEIEQQRIAAQRYNDVPLGCDDSTVVNQGS